MTIISIFNLHDPADQGTLFDLLAGNAVDVLEHAAGFLGSTLSRSDDGAVIVHHAAWRSQQAVQAMLTSPIAQASVAQTKRLARAQVIRAAVSHRYGEALPLARR